MFAGLLLTCAVVPFAHGEIKLEGPSSVAVADSPARVVCADLDGNGLADFATVSSYGMVSVVLNHGSSGFAAHVEYPVGQFPRGMHGNDLDGDGDVDLVTANTDANSISILWNRGDGTFLPHVPIPVGMDPYAVTSGDFDGDGMPDLAVANFYDFGPLLGSVSVLRNQGQGAFAPQVEIAVAADPQSVCTGDFDGDGDLDIATGHEQPPLTGSISILLNPGDGAFATVLHPTAGRPVRDMVACDLDADGDDDLVTTNLSAGTISVLESLGAGVFAPPVQHSAGLSTYAVIAVDLDGQGTPEVVGSNAGAGTISIFPGIGSVDLSSPITRVACASVYGLAAADIDGDGDIDLAGACPEIDAAFWMANAAGLGLPTANLTRVGSAPAAAASADFDGDGIEDLVTANRASDDVSILLTRRAGSFAPAMRFDVAAGSSPDTLAVGDVDGDGDVDIATGGSTNAVVSVLRNQGAGSFLLGATYATGSSRASVALADFDADHDLDLAAVAQPDRLYVRLNDGTGIFGPASEVPVGAAPSSLLAGDVDGDGDQDLLCLSGNRLWVNFNEGNGVFQQQLQFTLASNSTRGASLADCDSDGDLDVVACALNTTFGLVLSRNNGAGSFGVPTQMLTGTAPSSTAVVDLDGDGDRDLVVTNAAANTISVLERRADGSYAPHVQAVVGAQPLAVVAGDWDQDGDPDLAVACGVSKAFAIVVNAHTSGITLCLGDQPGALCPCSTLIPPTTGAGCENSLGLAGTLSASGASTLSSDGLTLAGSGMPDGVAIYVQGNWGTAPGVSFGDGLSCVGGPLRRIGTRVNVAHGSSVPDGSEPSIRVSGGIVEPGQRTYQVWYRDAAPYCTPSTSNATNGVLVTWRL